MLFPKFIIYKDELIIGRVEFHHELVPDNIIDDSKIKGGGFFMINREEKTVMFYGVSTAFGPFCRETLRECELPEKLSGYTKLIKEDY